MDGEVLKLHSAGMRGPSIALLSVMALAAVPCRAAPASQVVIPDALQQEAMTCVNEALQVCPDVFTAEDHGLACMTGKRESFSPRCRIIYDKVAHVLGKER